MDANPNFSTVTTAQLEHSITHLSADLNAATFQQLMLIAEFDTRRGWGDEGVRSCAHWLNWRCGVSLTAAREKLRVAHALSHLPQTRQAFASGQLSYSKARAITRVGTIDNEECLLSYARYGTASQLDKTVQLYRKQYVGIDGEIVAPAVAERQHAMQQREQRHLNTRWDDDGCLEIKVRLSAEQGAVVLKALEAAVDSLKEVVSDTQTPKAEEHTPAGVSDDPFQQQREREQQLHRVQNQRADALVLMANQSLQSQSTNANTADRYQVVVHVDSQVLAGEVHTKPTGEADCYIEQEAAVSVETARRLSCSCKIVTALTRGSEPLNIGRSSRAVPTSIRRALAIRDGQCQFPGCDCHKHLDAHHIEHWASGGETSLDNLIEVCHYHHVKLHEGGYSVQRLESGELIFYQPDETRVPTQSEPINSDEPLRDSEADLWQWCGDSMDYDTATHCIAHPGIANASATQPRRAYQAALSVPELSSVSDSCSTTASWVIGSENRKPWI